MVQSCVAQLAPNLGSKTTSHTKNSFALYASGRNARQSLVQLPEVAGQLARLGGQSYLLVHVEVLGDALGACPHLLNNKQ